MVLPSPLSPTVWMLVTIFHPIPFVKLHLYYEQSFKSLGKQ
ncbi:hypothetical protein AB0758_36265 [Tolypothrix bouteillei VB521301_2]